MFIMAEKIKSYEDIQKEMYKVFWNIMEKEERRMRISFIFSAITFGLSVSVLLVLVMMS